MQNNDHNKTTIEAYESGVEAYIAAGIPQTTGSVKDWLDFSLKLVPKRGRILELGSAYGRDAQYMEDHGFKVDRTDVANSFVAYMNSKGKEARILNALTDDLPSNLDMVYANAVLLHFDSNQTKQVLSKIKNALNPDGYIAFSVKIGKGENWSQAKLKMPRYFNYWSEKPLKNILSTTGFTPIYFEHGNTGHDNGEWFHVTAQVNK